NQFSSAFGYLSVASGNRSTALGEYSLASGSDSNAIGNHSTAAGDYSFASSYATSYNTGDISLGANSIAGVSAGSQTYDMALGYNAQATGGKSAAMGYNAQASGANAVALGYN